MDSSKPGLDRIESQRSINVSHKQRNRRYFPMNLIKSGILCTLRSLGFLESRGKGIKSVSEFFSNLRLSDLYDLPGEYVPMNPEVFSAISEGNKEWMENLKSYSTPMACLKSDQGESILHIAAAWGHLEQVKTIVSECPCLLLEPNSMDQLPIHVAARAGHLAVVEALVATLTFVSAKMSKEERETLNVYVLKDIDGHTPLHLALKDRYMKIAACLVKANKKALFLANKDGKSSLYLAIETGDLSIVKAMFETTDNDGFEGRNSNLESLEGRKDLVHAALLVMNTDILDVILKEYPSLGDEPDNEGRTNLSYAVSRGYYEGVCSLLDRSTRSVYVCNDDGSFPIHIAVEKCHTRVFRKILKRCPDSTYLLNKQGQNIFHIAAKSGKAASFLFRYFWRPCRKNHLMEKKDEDGNTPLHLATINWRPVTFLYLFSLNKEKCMFTQNNAGLTVLDIAESYMQPNYIFMERVTLMVLILCSAISSENPWMLCKKITKRSELPAGNKHTEYVNTFLVVATLVATVTFAAGFTIPGGFNGSGKDLGMPTLAGDHKLVYFMIFDILAMQISIMTISILIWAQLGDPSLVHKSLNFALRSLFVALLCMSVAFYWGVLVGFANIKGVALMLQITYAIFVFIMLYILGPHVYLQIPGIPGFLGIYFLPFVFLVDEDDYVRASAA